MAGVLLDAKTDVGFIAAVNRRLNLMIAYCFRRADFPWVAIWEENNAIEAAPWRSRTVALGLEFGTTPLPVAKAREFHRQGAAFPEYRPPRMFRRVAGRPFVMRPCWPRRRRGLRASGTLRWKGEAIAIEAVGSKDEKLFV